MRIFAKLLIVLLTIFGVAAAGAVLLMQFGAIRPASQQFYYIQRYGLTAIPCRTATLLYPQRDGMIVRDVAAGEPNVGDGVLYSDEHAGVASAYVLEKRTDGYTLVTKDNQAVDVPASLVFAVYLKRIPYMTEAVETLRTPLAIGVFVLAYIAAVLLHRMARMRQELAREQDLGLQDQEIESYVE